MADHQQEGYTQTVRCLICARPARRGATLCAQCKAAVRRARHTPNVKPEYLPHAPVVRRETRRTVERKATYSRAARSASRAVDTPPLGGWGIYATIIAFGLAVCLTGYLAIGDGERGFQLGRTAATPVVPADARDETTARADARSNAVAGARPSMPSLADNAETSFEPAADEHVAIFESLPTAPPRAYPDRKAAREGRTARDANAGVGATDARNAGIEPTPSFIATVPVAVSLAAPAAIAQPTAADRWQQLAFAQQRCERENVIAGFVCKERARLQYCDGAWGAEPQCPAAVVSLNTR